MIVLTSTQATRVRGRSPSASYAALDPVPLKDGTFILPEDVLTAPAHADVAAFLAALPKVRDADAMALAYGEEDAAAREALRLPSWQDAGVRIATPRRV